jgi:hypothetical protein
MNTELMYMPILRLRGEEQKVLTSFYFGKHIYPCVEIIKEVEGKAPQIKKGIKIKTSESKSFEQLHASIFSQIHSDKIFLDFPVHMKLNKETKPEVVAFLKKVVFKRGEKTNYVLKFSPLANKIIPVISTYSQHSGELNSIVLQEKDLRPFFKSLAFRTFPNTFNNDLLQIQSIAKSEDFLIVDLQDYEANPNDDDIVPIVEKLSQFKNCHIVVVRSALDADLTNIGLEHGKPVYEADNRLLKTYKQLHGQSFGDYAGIKKDKVSKGIGISPGFIFYNPLENNFYGFRGSLDAKGKSNQDLEDFETIIVPDVIKSEIVAHIKNSNLPYLSTNNRGWQMIQNICRGVSGKNMAKFKRISMEHYLHCIRTKIDAGHFS